jgi:hypothetical protein
MLGESDLGFVQTFENVKFGWFHPSPVGERFMPVLAGVGAALHRLHRMERNPVRRLMRGADQPSDGNFPRDIRRTTAYADFAAIVDEREAMQLQLRDPAGRVIETDVIAIDDTEWKISLVPKKLRAKMDEDSSRSAWAPGTDSFPRYQIQVHLRGVPRRCLPIPGLELPD